MQRKRTLQRAQTTPVKRRSIELNKMRVQEGIRRSEWTKKHGCGHTYGNKGKCVSDRKKKQRSGGNLSKRSKGMTGADIPCSACGSSTHGRSP